VASRAAPAAAEIAMPAAVAASATSTMITLLFVPAMYTLFEEGLNGLFMKGRPAPDAAAH
jgi:hypothetical protein